jgi:hypothetical protein
MKSREAERITYTTTIVPRCTTSSSMLLPTRPAEEGLDLWDGSSNVSHVQVSIRRIKSSQGGVSFPSPWVEPRLLQRFGDFDSVAHGFHC